ncbi:phage tail tube protein [Azospirillum sp. HJ39]|uniref:phage tail tube protein n=1 Tax=Azospirillum sp. HJ39 TaxID=3159496 RepID=UPI003558674A
MSSSNRVRLTGVQEQTFGTTPTTPRMRKQRVTSIGLSTKAVYVESDDIRDDRQNSDPAMVGQTNDGQIGIEWHFPVDGCLLSSEMESAFGNYWINTPARDNDGAAASVIQSVTASSQVVAVAAGPAFVAGHLVYFSGFGTANKGKLAKVTTGSATAPAFVGAGLVDEPSPAATARMKVVGCEGAAGDIAAVADGLTSQAGGLDFTTLGLSIGQWVKTGDTGAGYRFATAGTNGWARITAIAARKLTLDNLPAAWAADTGTGKTIRFFFGDVLKNGVTKIGVTLERGFMDHTPPTYTAQSGMRVGSMEFGGQAKEKATGSISFMGMKAGIPGPTTLDATPDDEPDSGTYPVMAFSSNCGRIGEGGVALGKPNWAKGVKFTITNNLRAIDAAADGDDIAPAPVDVVDGACDLAVELNTHFGDPTLVAKNLSGTVTSINTRLQKGVQAMIWDAPRLTPKEADPNVGGKNQDVMLPVKLTGSKDSLTGSTVIVNRIEFYR